jgi:hypothetical protein
MYSIKEIFQSIILFCTNEFLCATLLGMTTTKTAKTETAKPRPYGDTRKPEELRHPETFRLPASICEKLSAAAQKFDCSKTFYLELALTNQFKKDGISARAGACDH